MKRGKKGTITIAVKEPGRVWEYREIDGSLQSMQKIVGGHIEIGEHLDNVGNVIVCNEDGIGLGLAPQTVFCNGETRVFFGTIFVCGTCGEDFTSLI